MIKCHRKVFLDKVVKNAITVCRHLHIFNFILLKALKCRILQENFQSFLKVLNEVSSHFAFRLSLF